MTTIIDPVTGDEMCDILARLNPELLNQKCLDHGFVKVLDCMPRLVPLHTGNGDFALADGARISYQKGTRKINNDAALIDHLVRNQHTSPIELAELKFHIRLPIFVMRQHVRHRTASLNEESARYSELAGDFYIPDPDKWAMNTSANKQATVQQHLSETFVKNLYNKIKDHNEMSYDLYQKLLDGDLNDNNGIFTGFPPIAREQARMVLGVNVYTQIIWKIDLKNLLHYLKLRTDPHAQYEIRVFADAIARVVAALFPETWKSFKNNFIDGVNFSKQELNLINLILTGSVFEARDFITSLDWSKRRLQEFFDKFIKAGFAEERLLPYLKGVKNDSNLFA